MEIRNNFLQQNKQPSFGTIKIVKCNNADVNNLLRQKNLVSILRTHNIFKGQTPFHSDLANSIAKKAHNMGRTPEWLIQNAKLHGINVPIMDSAPLFDIAGKDLGKLNNFRLKSLFKMLIFNFKNKNTPEVLSLPKHLRWLKILSDFADKEQASFDKFLKKNNAVEMDFPRYTKSLITDLP